MRGQKCPCQCSCGAPTQPKPRSGSSVMSPRPSLPPGLLPAFARVRSDPGAHSIPAKGSRQLLGIRGKESPPNLAKQFSSKEEIATLAANSNGCNRVRENRFKYFGHARIRLKFLRWNALWWRWIAVCTPPPQQRAGRCGFVGLLGSCIARYRGTRTSSCAFAALNSGL